MSRNRRGEKVEGGWIGEGEVGGENWRGEWERRRGALRGGEGEGKGGVCGEVRL